jgi:hypothetical protein
MLGTSRNTKYIQSNRSAAFTKEQRDGRMQGNFVRDAFHRITNSRGFSRLGDQLMGRWSALVGAGLTARLTGPCSYNFKPLFPMELTRLQPLEKLDDCLLLVSHRRQ